MIDNFAHQQSSHFHLDHLTEILRLQNAKLSGIFLINRKLLICHRVHRMQHPRNPYKFPYRAAVRIDIAVIISHTQPEQPHITACIFRCQLPILQQALHGVRSMLDTKDTIVIYFIDTDTAVAGTYQNFRRLFHLTGPFCQSSGKKFIEGTILFRLIIPHIDAVEANEIPNQKCR